MWGELLRFFDPEVILIQTSSAVASIQCSKNWKWKSKKLFWNWFVVWTVLVKHILFYILIVLRNRTYHIRTVHFNKMTIVLTFYLEKGPRWHIKVRQTGAKISTYPDFLFLKSLSIVKVIICCSNLCFKMLFVKFRFWLCSSEI